MANIKAYQGSYTYETTMVVMVHKRHARAQAEKALCIRGGRGHKITLLAEELLALRVVGRERVSFL